MTHYTPSREEWEQEKSEKEQEHWYFVNAEAEALIQQAETATMLSIVPLPIKDILQRIGEITGHKVQAYGSEGRKYYGLDFKKTHFVFNTYKQDY